MNPIKMDHFRYLSLFFAVETVNVRIKRKEIFDYHMKGSRKECDLYNAELTHLTYDMIHACFI